MTEGARRDVDEQGPSWREFARLEATCEKGFAEQLEQLRAINGRVGRTEVELGKQDARIKNTEHELFRRRRADHQGQGEEWARAAVSKRESALIGFGLVILTVLLKTLELVGTKLWDVLVTHRP